MQKPLPEKNGAICHYGHYTPVGCRVKRHSMCNDGVKSFLKRQAFKKPHPVCTKYYAPNAYWAQPKAILLAMLVDSDKHMCQNYKLNMSLNINISLQILVLY